MVNTLLIIACAATLLFWFVQEWVGRRPALRWTRDNLQNPERLAQIDRVAQPAWSRWGFQAIQLLWGAWVVTALLYKDGDFALVLVLVTLLCGIVAGLDRWGFAPGRERFFNSKSVAQWLSGLGEQQRRIVRSLLGRELAVAEYAKSFFPVLLVVLVLRSFVVEPFQIPSSSMVPTLRVGDYILVNKFSYGLRLPVLGTKILEVGEPQRGDVMVFFPPHDSRYFIKRVIGLPGDQVTYRDKTLYINGERASQTLLAELPPGDPKVEVMRENLLGVEHQIHNSLQVVRGDFSITVKPGHYFMMGDNRDNSSDSRVWGQVPERNVVGQAFAIWMHWRGFGELPSFSRVGAID